MTARRSVACLILVAVARCAAADMLSDLVDEAVEGNPEIAAAKAKWDAAKARVPQAGGLADPMIGADVERSGSTAIDDYSDIEYMVAQDFPWFGKRGLAGRVEQGMARRAAMDYRMKVLEITAMVKRMYYDLWQVGREIETNHKSRDLMQQFVDIAVARYEAGKTSQADVLKARTELAKLSEDEIDLVRMRDSTRADLNRFLGRAGQAEVAVDDIELVPDFVLAASDAEQDSPELIGMKEGMIASAKAQADLAGRTYRPDFQVRVEARQFNGGSSIEEYDTALFLNIPWFNRRKNNAAIAEAKAGLRSAEQDYEGARLRVAAEVSKLHSGIHAMQHHFELYRDNIIPQQRATVEAARAGYESNDMDFMDLLDAQRMLLEFEMLNLHHAAEAFRLAAQLEAIVGGEPPEAKP